MAKSYLDIGFIKFRFPFFFVGQKVVRISQLLKNSLVLFFFLSTLIFLSSMECSPAVLIVYLMPSDKSVGAGLSALVSVSQFLILTSDVRRTVTVHRKLTE